MTSPLVSIGMPVYNGEKYLRGAIESLLSQSYTNLELIISDDASTDHTPDICKEYASKDNRVRYYREDKNRGITWNFSRVLELSKGKYFMWAAQDDLREKDFIEKCLLVLEGDPEISLCASRVIYISPDGSEAGRKEIALSTKGMGVAQRIKSFLKGRGNDPVFYGLIRRSALEGMSLENLMGQDYLFVFRLLLKGHIETVPFYLFKKRTGGGSRSITQMARTYGVTSKNILKWHRAFLFKSFLALIRKEKIPFNAKFRLHAALFRLYVRDYMYFDLADRRNSRIAKRLAYRKTHAREGNVPLKILIFFELPFLHFKKKFF
jgi:glycosyltransferase involved in cell wall biosynthesis